MGRSESYFEAVIASSLDPNKVLMAWTEKLFFKEASQLSK